MFTFTETAYQLLRNRGRTVLLVCISALLCGCLAIYIGNIDNTQRELEQLGETNPVTLQVSASGLVYDYLDIDPALADQLPELGLSDIRITSHGNAAYDPLFKGQDNFIGGDCQIMAVNCKETAGFSDESDWDLSFYLGQNPYVLWREILPRHSLKVGDTIDLELYQTLYGGTLFQKVTDSVELEVAAICTLHDTGAELYVPLEWMRAQTEAVGLLFSYTSYSAKLDDPLELNAIKSRIAEMGFVSPFAESTYNPHLGNAVSMDDEIFIKTARQLGENLQMSQRFLPVFCGVVALLVTLAVFLVLRGARREIAIANSLGRAKVFLGLSHLIALLCTQLAGCLLALAVMMPAGLGMEALIVCGSFIISAVIGDALGLLMVLWFDPIRMLLAE